jgi:hypothetical protein
MKASTTKSPTSVIPKRLRDGVWETIETGIQEWIAVAYLPSAEYKTLVEAGVQSRVKKLREEAKEAKLNDKKWMNEEAVKIDLEIREEKVANFKKESASLPVKPTVHIPKDYLVFDKEKK